MNAVLKSESSSGITSKTTTEDVNDDDTQSKRTYDSEDTYALKRKLLTLRTGIPFYEIPRERYRWGQKQGHAVHVWGSLFFDLAYVGIAFQLGQVIETALKEEINFIGNLGLSIAIFIGLLHCWISKMAYDSRFEADSLFHRLFQIILGSLVSFAANSIVTVEVMEGTAKNGGGAHAAEVPPMDTNNNSMDHSILGPQPLTLSCCLLLYFLLDYFSSIETLQSDYENARLFSKSMLKWKISLILLCVAAVICSSLQGPLWVTALFWFITGIWQTIFILIISIFKLWSRKTSIPMHINWAIKRYNELILLMIGETVISIIIVHFIPTATFLVTYIFCYLLCGNFAFIVFSTCVANPDQHALRRSSYRGILFTLTTAIQCFSFILVGVGFKVILEQTEKITPDINVVWFMSTCLVICMLSLFLGRSLHHGIDEEFFALPTKRDKALKFMFWLLKLFFISILFIAPYMNAPSWGLMLYYWAITAILFAIQLGDLNTFKEHHEIQVKKQIEERVVKFQHDGIVLERH